MALLLWIVAWGSLTLGGTGAGAVLVTLEGDLRARLVLSGVVAALGLFAFCAIGALARNLTLLADIRHALTQREQDHDRRQDDPHAE